MQRINFITKLGEHFNIPVENYGFRGNSQNGIAFDFFKFVRNNTIEKDHLFLITWSGYSRKTIFNSEENNYRDWSHQNITSDDEISFINNCSIRAVHSYLSEKKLPFLFLSSFLRFFDIKEVDLTGIKNNWVDETLFEMCVGERKVVPNYVLNHDSNEYFVKNKNLSACMHPSELGHKVIANNLLKHIKMLDSKSKKSEPLHTKVHYYSHPWEHFTVDNFLSFSELSYIRERLDSLSLQEDRFREQDGKRLNTVIQSNDKIFKILEPKFIELCNLIDSYDESKEEIVVEASLIKPKFCYPIHNDRYTKVFNFVLHISENGHGTKLYENSDGSGFKKTMEWIPGGGGGFLRKDHHYHNFDTLNDSSIRQTILLTKRTKEDLNFKKLPLI